MNLPALPAVAAPAAPGMPAKSADEPGASGFAKLLDHAREGQRVEPGAPEAAPQAPGPRAADAGRREGDRADAADAPARPDGDAGGDAAGEVARDVARDGAIDPADPAPAEGRPQLHGRSQSDRARNEAARTRVPAIVDGKGIESAVAADPPAAHTTAKHHPTDIATLLPGWTCTLPLPTPPGAATAVSASDAEAAADGAATDAQRSSGSARQTVATLDDAATRAADRAANAQAAASVLQLPAQPAASAAQASAAIEAALPRAARELEPGLVVAAPAAAAPALASAGPALATQLRWLAQEHVQQAQITLNPAGMGPVAVQIVIDGPNARVDFSADQAATRQAIEASLPVLAAALDEGGLKLSGGGVHDGSAQRHPAWGAPAQAQRASASHAEPEAGARGFGPATRAAVARGLVDLVA